ncbi:glutathione S-transferase family protein [Shimia sp. FJ5]|uniref:glutathione S-transferase family protein n=1 Tax=Shimia sp. FJ5 TaxID=3079054 RepID=UPI002628C97C|nr:glutathione S-transferase family protein [Shimia sp. FJ5]MDV4145965.1 glutathione S-transferase family protein [Shimia sp. FJ5]
MLETLRLHYAPDNASLIVRLALEELGVTYETVLVDRAAQAQRSVAFRAINPAAKIPALETPDGALFETAAILLYLADRFGRLAPDTDDPARGPFLSWLFYISNTVHANLRLTFYPQIYAGNNDASVSALRAGARSNLLESLRLLDILANEGHAWFNGTTPSLLDLYLAAILRWMAIYPAGDTSWFSLASYPGLLDMASSLENRDSVVALIRAEGMAPCPFTKPAFPNPPEGVAL